MRILRTSFIVGCLLSVFTMQFVAEAQESHRNEVSFEQKFSYRVNALYESYRKVVENDRFRGGWVDGKVVYRWDNEGKSERIEVDPVTGESKPAPETQKKPEKTERKGRGRDRAISPDGKWRMNYVGYNAVLVNLSDKTEKKITTDGTAEHFYTGVNWSPDSKKCQFFKFQKGQGRVVTMVEAAPKDQVQPKVHTYRYDKPGDKIDQRIPMICYVDGNDAMQIDVPILENHYNLSHFAWRSDDELTFHGVERGFGKYHVVLVNTKARESKVLIAEESDTYVNSGNTTWSYIENESTNREIIWHSERDGWGHLYLYDGVTGEVKNQITKGEFVVRRIVYVDEEKRRLLFTAGGEVKGLDPYFVQYYWVNFDGSGMTRITNPKRNHDLDFSDDYRYAIDISSTADQAPSYDLINGQTGKLIKNLGVCNLENLRDSTWQRVEPFMAKDREGKFEVWGNIYRPPNFDPKKKYPVIEYIYAGPHGQFASKKFSFWNRTIDEVAQLGFIVVQIDGRGTNYRCREFSHFAYKNLIDSGFPDRIAWMKAAAEKYSQMDLSRVGIYGGSAGGQSSTAALLEHGDFYKVAVSDCGCHDNRMDKIWWNEQWMDYPVGPHYAKQSNVTLAHKLKGALMLTVGELDRNVDPASTMQVAHALTRANKKFDIYVIPSSGHGAGEQIHMRSLRAQFFAEHLGSPSVLEK